MKETKWFELIKYEFSQADKEWQWTYSIQLEFTFNEQKITKITITDHYKVEHDDVMTNEKILEIIRKLNTAIRKPEPKKNPNWPDPYVEKGIEYQGKKYLLVFWFERNSLDWLWIRDCYPN